MKMSLRDEKKTPLQDWRATLISALVGFMALLVVVASFFLWRWIERREARRASPQAVLMRQWYLADEAIAKAAKKNAQKKKWWTWPWGHKRAPPPQFELTSTRTNGEDSERALRREPDPHPRARLGVYCEWAESVPVTSEDRSQVFFWDHDDAEIPLRFYAPPAGLRAPPPTKPKDLPGLLETMK